MAVLGVGVVLKQIVASSASWDNCRVLHSDAVGIAFEVERTISETGVIETAVSQVFLPWSSVKHVLVMEQIL
ncbi:MAG: hypothetical protein ABIR28_08360 [Vicinamibacteria bacterium]